MREEYLHHLFKSKILGKSFQTTSGLSLEVLKFGTLNPNAGPDFLDAQISLEGTIWAGSIEFHVKSSDWFLHRHQTDSRYDNVVAHFVYEHDKEVEINGVKIPTVILKDKIDQDHFAKYCRVTESKDPIPCSANIQEVDTFVVFQQKERALFNRMIRKSAHLLADLDRLNGDTERLFYLTLAKTFGGKVNGDSFVHLIEKVDLRALQKLRQTEFAIPAILFGTSGLLPNFSEDDYVRNLITEFTFQKSRLNIQPLAGHQFRFSRMNPPGFPTIRLAQFAELIRRNGSVGVFISEDLTISQIKENLQVEIPVFWQLHYRFEAPTTRRRASVLSNDFMNLLVINAIVPFLFAIGLKTGDENLKQRALGYLSEIDAETNRITRLWTKLGVEISSSFDTQALIEQKNEFCSKKKCLFCTIGLQLLKS